MRPVRLPYLWRKLLLLLVFPIVAALAPHCRGDADSAVLSGNFGIIDGDTLTLGTRRLRIRGIDAPESAQRCGEGARVWSCGVAATGRLRSLVGPATVCEARGSDRYGRLLVRCQTPAGDIGARMVRDGLAVSYGLYQREEDEAKAAGRGLWAGAFQRPSDWRRSHRTPTGQNRLRDWIASLWE